MQFASFVYTFLICAGSVCCLFWLSAYNKCINVLGYVLFVSFIDISGADDSQDSVSPV